MDPDQEVFLGVGADHEFGGVVCVFAPWVEEVHVDRVDASVGIQVAVVHSEVHFAGFDTRLVIGVDEVVLEGVGRHAILLRVCGPDVWRLPVDAGDVCICIVVVVSDHLFVGEGRIAVFASRRMDEGIAVLLGGEDWRRQAGLARGEDRIRIEADACGGKLVTIVVVDILEVNPDGLEGLVFWRELGQVGVDVVASKQVDDDIVGTFPVEDSGAVMPCAARVGDGQGVGGAVVVERGDGEVLGGDGGLEDWLRLINVTFVLDDVLEVGSCTASGISDDALAEAQGDGAVVEGELRLAEEEAADCGEGKFAGGGGG